VALEEQLLTASLTNTFHEARKVLDTLYETAPQSIGEADNLSPDDEYHEWEEALEFYIDRAFRDVAILAERLKLPILAKGIAKARKKIERMREHHAHPEAPTHVSPPLQIARHYFESLSVMTQGREITGLGVFENILQSAGKIMQARKPPESETQISKALREVLGFAFPGQVRVSTIEKTLKSYKPDIGVITLMAAAETKFCVTKAEAAGAIDGIYADMKGYSGRDDWRSFYAVIYMTEAFYTQKDVDREFRLVNADFSWTPYVVLGPGQRKKKALK
jgi:hypothetical protein